MRGRSRSRPAWTVFCSRSSTISIWASFGRRSPRPRAGSRGLAPRRRRRRARRGRSPDGRSRSATRGGPPRPHLVHQRAASRRRCSVIASRSASTQRARFSSSGRTASGGLEEPEHVLARDEGRGRQRHRLGARRPRRSPGRTRDSASSAARRPVGSSRPVWSSRSAHAGRPNFSRSRLLDGGGHERADVAAVVRDLSEQARRDERVRRAVGMKSVSMPESCRFIWAICSSLSKSDTARRPLMIAVAPTSRGDVHEQRRHRHDPDVVEVRDALVDHLLALLQGEERVGLLRVAQRRRRRPRRRALGRARRPRGGRCGSGSKDPGNSAIVMIASTAGRGLHNVTSVPPYR